MLLNYYAPQFITKHINKRFLEIRNRNNSKLDMNKVTEFNKSVISFPYYGDLSENIKRLFEDINVRNDRQIKWKIEKPFVKCCFNGLKGNLFCIELSRRTKNGFISRTRSGKNHGFHLVRSAHRLQGQIALAVRQCSVFGGTSVLWCTSSY